MPVHSSSLSRVFRGFALCVFAALSLPSCHPSDGLSMEEDQAIAVISDDDSTSSQEWQMRQQEILSEWQREMQELQQEVQVRQQEIQLEWQRELQDLQQDLQEHQEELQVVLLESCAHQLCDAVTIAPGTEIHIPYVLPIGWHYVAHEVHVVRAITDSAQDYHRVEPLPADFSFRGDLRRGYMLRVQAPSVSALQDWTGASLKLKLAFSLREAQIPERGVGGEGAEVSPAFGAAAWQAYFGVTVGEEPPLPAHIEEILNSEAPFLLDGESTPRRVRDNHLLTLIPRSVDGRDFTLNELGMLVLQNRRDRFTLFRDSNKQRWGDHSHGYGYYSEYLTDENRHSPLADAPCWVLLSKTVLKDSWEVSFSELVAMEHHGYELPNALEVATSLLAHYARSGGKRWYAPEHHTGGWSFTSCSDVDKDGSPLAVGEFQAWGITVCSSSVRTCGVACVRKLRGD